MKPFNSNYTQTALPVLGWVADCAHQASVRSLRQCLDHGSCSGTSLESIGTQRRGLKNYLRWPGEWKLCLMPLHWFAAPRPLPRSYKSGSISLRKQHTEQAPLVLCARAWEPLSAAAIPVEKSATSPLRTAAPTLKSFQPPLAFYSQLLQKKGRLESRPFQLQVSI